MSTATVSDKLKTLARDLTRDYPRSPRDTGIGGYVIAARVLDKCRAVLNGSNGEYNFDCPMDRLFFDFSGINSQEFRDFVATGASDAEVSDWVSQHAAQKERKDVIVWNNGLRYATFKDLPVELQVFFEDYVPANIPAGRQVGFWFDVFDLEEKRL